MAGTGTAHLREDQDDLVLRVEHMVVEFPSRRGTVHAVSDVSLDLASRRDVGHRRRVRLRQVDDGQGDHAGPAADVGHACSSTASTCRRIGTDEMRQVRSNLQMIFQDAISSLNPRRRIRDVVAEPLVIRWLEEQPRSPVGPPVGALRAVHAAALAPSRSCGPSPCPWSSRSSSG